MKKLNSIHLRPYASTMLENRETGFDHSYLDDEHVDDPDVLDVLVLLKLCPQLLVGGGLRDWQVERGEHERDVPVPGLVEREDALAGLANVVGQQGLHLRRKGGGCERGQCTIWLQSPQAMLQSLQQLTEK